MEDRALPGEALLSALAAAWAADLLAERMPDMAPPRFADFDDRLDRRSAAMAGEAAPFGIDVPLSLITPRAEQGVVDQGGPARAEEASFAWNGGTLAGLGTLFGGSPSLRLLLDDASPTEGKVGVREGVAGVGNSEIEQPPKSDGTPRPGDPPFATMSGDDIPEPVPTSVGDRVWLDANADGIQSQGETGKSNVTVRLLNGANPQIVLATTTTNASGLYLFDNLAAGSYIVEFVAPQGTVFMAQDQGTDDTLDSDANPTTGRTQSFPLATWQAKRDIDAALRTAPVANADSYSGFHDRALEVPAAGVLTNDSALGGLSMWASVVTGPQHGALQLGGNGSFSYTPNMGYVGNDSFTYKATDGFLTSVPATVNLAITNSAPVANPDSYSVGHDKPLSVTGLGVIANDTDGEADSLTAILVSGVSHGSLTLQASGSFSYMPNPLYFGVDSFTYKVNDGLLQSATSTVTINVGNAVPVAVADAYATPMNGVITVGPSGLLSNDTDADGDALTASHVSGVGPAHGTVTVNPNGSFVYTPNPGYVGTDSFQYRAGDGIQQSTPTTVTLTMHFENSAPVAEPDEYGVDTNGTLVVTADDGVLDNDSDPDGDALTAELVSGTSNGSLILNSDGSFVYQPNADYEGTDYFYYRAKDSFLAAPPVQVKIEVERLTSIVYRPKGQGTTGDLSNDNPTGANGTPNFAGGYRLFPDAADYATRTVSRNIVRVRATINRPAAGVTVYFRAFDVDDPSADATLDPNDQRGAAAAVNTGKDNRGSVGGASLNQPEAAGAQGYRGRLRRVGGGFAAEGALRSALTVLDGVGGAYAEVELATSFNPGDNFRVATSMNRGVLAGLNDETGVPTTGPIANFPGLVADQLSIWRRVHIEQDYMGEVAFWAGNAKSVMVSVTGGANAEGERDLILSTPLNWAEKFTGGVMRDNSGQRYVILRHTTGATPTVTIFAPKVGEFDTFSLSPPVQMVMGDFQTGQITSTAQLANGNVVVTTNLIISQNDQYQGGILRTGGDNYHIVNNSSGANGTVTIVADVAPANGAVELYEDEYSTSLTNRRGHQQIGDITAAGVPVNGLVLLNTNLYITEVNRFAGGTLQTGGKNYPICSNTLGENAQVTVLSNTPIVVGEAKLFINLGTLAPTYLLGATSSPGMYSMLQSSKVRANNRFADAYIEPELQALDAFDSQIDGEYVTPMPHLVDAGPILRTIVDPYRGTKPGGAPRQEDYETDVFWTVYSTTAYEPPPDKDSDPISEQNKVWGGTDPEKRQISVVYLETIRDGISTFGDLTEADSVARTTIHEIGHQFRLVRDIPGEHRPAADNIMFRSSLMISNEQYYFAALDIKYLRE